MERSVVQDALRGVVGIPLAPFDDAGELDLEALEANVSFLLDGGIRAIAPGGNTGEFYALSPAEYATCVARTVALCCEAGAVAIVGVGYDLSTATAAARAAADAGAGAVMVHQPPHPHVTEGGLLDYYEHLGAASPLPIVPYVSRPTLSTAGIRALVERVRPAGIKYAVNDLQAFAHAVVADPEQSTVWVCGSAERWAPFFWPAGAEGFTSGLVNVTTELPLQLLDALRSGNRSRARELWARIEPFEALRAGQSDGVNVAVVKEAVRQAGRPAGDVRPPATPVGEGERHRIAELLAEWGLL